MNRFMIAGTRSGSGKTMITCALLQAFVNRNLETASFKCGPDYIDPMFHSRIIGADSHNLDSFFCSSETVCFLLDKYFKELNIIEGVMGFYDGVNGYASSCRLAVETNTPVVIVIDCKGMSDSIGALMYGFLNYTKPNNIIGFIFNRLPEQLEELAMSLCKKMNVIYFGRFPYEPECALESRHLGLVTAGEIKDLKEKTNRLAALAEQNILIDRLLESTMREDIVFSETSLSEKNPDENVRIAVAQDEAFCFYYKENLDILRELGCETVAFSPMNDKKFPDNISGLIIGGGYPELYARRLSENKELMAEIKSCIIDGMPTIAECGGFMYLHDELQDNEGKFFKTVGVINGRAFKTKKLRRFGYINMTANCDSLLFADGGQIPAHEFHYWDSTNTGSDLTARKVSSGVEYLCGHTSPTLYAGFPHLYFYSDINIAKRFAEKCSEYKDRKSYGIN